MSRFDNITPDEIHVLKENASEGNPQEHVLLAVELKQGNQLQTLTAHQDVVGKTTYHWFNLFKEQPLKEAPYDTPRPRGPANHVIGGIQYQ